jgi:PAS domain S-box-containing protein
MQPLGKVLVADDEPELLAALCESLAAGGYEVAGAASGTEALKRLGERDFDVLLTDLMMPGMDGIALLKAALEIDPHVVGVIMTGQGTVQTAVEAMKTGAFDYVLKPFKFAQITPVLARAVNVRRLKLENVELRQTVALYEMGKAISFTLDMNTILNKLLDAALAQCSADEGSVMVPTREGDELFIAAVGGEGRERILGERVSCGKGIAGWVAREREPLILRGAVHDPRFTPFRPRPEIRCSISMPMLSGGKLAGVLNVNATRQRRPFSLGDIKSLNILTSIAAPALENCWLYGRIKEDEERYRVLYESSRDAVMTLAPPSWKFAAGNPATIALFGAKDEGEFVTKGPWDVSPERQPDGWLSSERAAEMIAKAMENGSNFFEWTHRRLDGTEFPAAVLFTRVDLGGRRFLQATVRDVTEQKKLEEQLVQSQKMEAIGKLAGGVAHDFNNILSVIIVNAGFLIEGLPENDPRRKDAEEIQRAGRRAADLTRQLLAFSRKQVLEPRVLDLNETIKGMHKMLKRVIGEDIDLVTNPGRGVWTVKADPGQMEQVLMNLAVNARDAMPKGGRLTIETKNVALDETYVRTHEGVVPGPHVMLAMSDNGIGMDKATLSRIFEPFFTTKGVGKGTGLGLSTVYGIVKQSGGHIFAYSEPGKGTSFKIYLPRHGEAAEIGKTENPEPPPLGTETVLLVEDEEMVRQVARGILRKKGYTVIDTGDSDEALAICREGKIKFDLLLTDVVMPKMSGPDLAREVLALCPHVKVLFMSGYTDDAVVHHGVLDKGTAFIQKPLGPDSLPRKVREVLNGADQGAGRKA